ncbi:MAG TPA: MMPL family transporter [Polyangiales bacterium]|nr:MMPL family transporter [Polyangiales bacterium]
MRSALLFVIIAAACGLFVAMRMELRTPITEFLPAGHRRDAIELARELANAPQARTVAFTLRGGSAADFAEALRKSGLFAWVRGGVSEQEEQAFYELAFPARLGLLQIDGEGPLSDEVLDARVAALRERLGGPWGMLERRFAAEDPLGSFSDLLQAQLKTRAQLTMVDRQLVTTDGAWQVVFAATRASAFETAAQQQVEKVIFASVPKGATLEWSGLSRYALLGEKSVRGDIERISSLSVIGIFVLYLFVFRSLREPLLVLLPIGFGCLVATALCQLVFGYVHGLALAFGSAVIGVAEDFSTHYFAHRLITPASESNDALMERLWPGMWLGALTTVAGIATLFASGFRGLEQMAMFGALGVLAALFCTRYALPPLSRRGVEARERPAVKAGVRFLDRMAARPVLALWFVGPSLVFMLAGAPKLRFEDSLKALRTTAPALDAENARVQQRLGLPTKGQVVVTLGDDDEQALAHSEQVLGRLSGRVALRSVSTLLPSLATQRARRARMTDDPTFWPRLEAALKRHDFVPAAFAPFREALAGEAAVLTPAELAQSPLASSFLTPFRAELSGQVAYLTSVEASEDLTPLIASVPGAHYIDQDALYSAAYRDFRTRTLWLLALGLVLVLGILLARYRNLRTALLGMVPALLGAGAAVGVEALRGVSLNLLHVIGVLLVLSMGVDYGIYALESQQHGADDGVTTLGSVLLAALTTVLSFGLLGVSDNPALAAVGSTVGFGLVFTVLASPVALAFTRLSERT